MNEEFNLSEKMLKGLPEKYSTMNFFWEIDVKEFIKRLKEWIDDEIERRDGCRYVGEEETLKEMVNIMQDNEINWLRELKKMIDKLVGDKLK